MGGVRPANSATGRAGGKNPAGGWFREGQKERLKGTRTCRLPTASGSPFDGLRANGESARPATGETASSKPPRLRRGGEWGASAQRTAPRGGWVGKPHLVAVWGGEEEAHRTPTRPLNLRYADNRSIERLQSEWGASAQRTAPRGGRVGKTHPGRVVPGGAKGAPERHKNLPPSSSLRVTLRRALATPSRSTESPQETFADRMNGESARPANSATGRAGGKAPPGGWFWEGQRKRLKGTRACRLPTASG